MIKNCKKGFTLLELLVVVLIIGILASIALPQYRMAVGKAKFSTLKNLTKSVQQAAQRYYLANNEYPKVVSGLDIDLNVKSERAPSHSLEITTSDDIICNIWTNDTNYISCGKKIFGNTTYYYIDRITGKPLYCLVSDDPDPKGSASRLCAKETNRAVKSTCATICEYSY